MATNCRNRFALFVPSLALIVILAGVASGDAAGQPASSVHTQGSDDHHFRLNSTTFENGAVFPSSMIANITIGSVCAGGNQSPELSWTDPPRGTKSLVLVLFDITAGFTHWAVYNIPTSVTELPENAGSVAAATTTFGDQTLNDLGIFGYIGPCPPSGLVHHYEFTVYALNVGHLDLHSAPAPFFSDAENLYRTMFDHVLGSASINGFFSCPADSNPSLPAPSSCS